MVVGLASGSRSANKSIHAAVFFSLLFVLIASFLLVSLDALELCIFFKKSNVKIFDDVDDDCVAAIGLQAFAALLKMSSKQSVSLGSSVVMSSKLRIVESLTLSFLSIGVL